MLRLTIWMNMPSFHQDSLFSALASSEEVDLQVIFARNLSEDRVQLGWNEGARDYPHRVLRHKHAFGEAISIARSQPDRLHVVNGIWAEPAFAVALCALGLAGSKFAVYAESPDPGQSRSVSKRLVRKTFGAWIAQRATGMLAISQLAVNYYIELGFDKSKVYPFGYFRRASRARQEQAPTTTKDRLEILFVGQLIHRKGVDVLLHAIAPLINEWPDLRLTLIGAGEQAQDLKGMAGSLGIENRVAFAGALPADKIPERLATADVLVLPSRWDGWGMVVNEALSAGVPAIVSDRCGASDLIRQAVNGYVFRSEDVEDLRQSLRSFLSNRNEWPAMRAAAAATGRAISPEVASAYLIECLKHLASLSHKRPIPPWLQAAASQSANL